MLTSQDYCKTNRNMLLGTGTLAQDASLDEPTWFPENLRFTAPGMLLAISLVQVQEFCGGGDNEKERHLELKLQTLVCLLQL